MSAASTNLALPFLQPGQAQKHVTVNESLLRLDALVQLSAASATTSAEPGAPADGQVYILPAGKAGTHWGAMAEGALAYYRDGAWEEIAPRAGWIAYVQDSGAILAFDGSGWARVAPRYEDGAFTPALTFSSPGDLSVSYTAQSGRFIRVGDKVHVQARLVCTPTFSTASGQLRIGGLPFASFNEGANRSAVNVSAVSNVNFGANDRQIAADIGANASHINIGMIVSNGAARALGPADLTSGVAFGIFFSAEYICGA